MGKATNASDGIMVNEEHSNSGNGCWLMKLEDLCQHMNVSIAQLQKLRRVGKVLRPNTTLGRSPRWLSDEFFDWLRAGCPAAVYWTWKGGSKNNRR